MLDEKNANVYIRRRQQEEIRPSPPLLRWRLQGARLHLLTDGRFCGKGPLRDRAAEMDPDAPGAQAVEYADIYGRRVRGARDVHILARGRLLL